MRDARLPPTWPRDWPRPEPRLPSQDDIAAVRGAAGARQASLSCCGRAQALSGSHRRVPLARASRGSPGKAGAANTRGPGLLLARPGLGATWPGGVRRLQHGCPFAHTLLEASLSSLLSSHFFLRFSNFARGSGQQDLPTRRPPP